MLKSFQSILVFSILTFFGGACFADGDCGGSGADVNDKTKLEKLEKEA